MCVPALYGQSGQTFVTDGSTATTLANTCGPLENVDLNGTFHTESTFVANSNGSFHFTFNTNIQMTGVGEVSGLKYVENDNLHQEVNVKTVAQEQSFGTKLKLISQGSSPNLIEHITLHVVVDQNNNVVVQIFHQQFSCK
jgi:hypothetical protein